MAFFFAVIEFGDSPPPPFPFPLGTNVFSVFPSLVSLLSLPLPLLLRRSFGNCIKKVGRVPVYTVGVRHWRKEKVGHISGNEITPCNNISENKSDIERAQVHMFVKSHTPTCATMNEFLHFPFWPPRWIGLHDVFEVLCCTFCAHQFCSEIEARFPCQESPVLFSFDLPIFPNFPSIQGARLNKFTK